MIIGITGKIGSGKTTVSKLLLDHGRSESRIYYEDAYNLLNIDELVLELYDDVHVIYAIRARLGVSSKDEILNMDCNGDTYRALKEIFTPYIIGYIMALKGNWIIDIPLLFEANLSEHFDKIINVNTTSKMRKARVNPRLLENFDLMNSLQFPNELRNQLSDFVINNNYGNEELATEVNLLAEGLL